MLEEGLFECFTAFQFIVNDFGIQDLDRQFTLRQLIRRDMETALLTVYWFSVKWKPRALGLAGWGT
jgi:hypothetical protein